MQFKFHSTEYLIEPYISKAITHKNEEFVITDLIDPKTLHAYLSSDPDKLTVKLMTYEIKTLLANKVTSSQKPNQELINNFRQKFVNESELQFNELYDIKHDDYKEDISYYTTSGEYELIVNYSTDSTIQDLGNIDVVNFNLPNKNINIKISSAHYIINNKVDYISFALCCRKLYNKYPNLKTIIVIPEKLNMQIINKIIQKEFNNNLVKIITYEATNTN